MNTLDIHPYYHPTTVFIIDDNMDFLQNFSLHLDKKLACRLFNSAAEAMLDVENATATHLAQATPYWCDECVVPRKSQNLVEVNLALIAKGMENPDRFAENSVIIIDYDMPFVNGVNFCRMLKNSTAKKILISGVADEKIAVEAFNDGVIDKFLLKSLRNSTSLINDYIFESQNAYFRKKTIPIKDTLALHADVYGFIDDPDFGKLFHGLCESKGIVEYYLTTDPCGFVMLDETAKCCQIIVYSAEELETHADIIQDQHGPAELYTAVKEKTIIPFFSSYDGYYAQNIYDWRSSVYPAKRLHATSSYYYTIIDNPAFYGNLSERVARYDKYLEL